MVQGARLEAYVWVGGWMRERARESVREREREARRERE